MDYCDYEEDICIIPESENDYRVNILPMSEIDETSPIHETKRIRNILESHQYRYIKREAPTFKLIKELAKDPQAILNMLNDANKSDNRKESMFKTKNTWDNLPAENLSDSDLCDSEVSDSDSSSSEFDAELSPKEFGQPITQPVSENVDNNNPVEQDNKDDSDNERVADSMLKLLKNGTLLALVKAKKEAKELNEKYKKKIKSLKEEFDQEKRALLNDSKLHNLEIVSMRSQLHEAKNEVTQLENKLQQMTFERNEKIQVIKQKMDRCKELEDKLQKIERDTNDRIKTSEKKSLDAENRVKTAILFLTGELTLEKPANDNSDFATCKICYEKPIDTTIVPCGHTAFCGSCIANSSECPSCRNKIQKKIKIYFS